MPYAVNLLPVSLPFYQNFNFEQKYLVSIKSSDKKCFRQCLSWAETFFRIFLNMIADQRQKKTASKLVAKFVSKVGTKKIDARCN